jgi:hypothetical protein
MGYSGIYREKGIWRIDLQFSKIGFVIGIFNDYILLKTHFENGNWIWDLILRKLLNIKIAVQKKQKRHLRPSF